jgi:hypothetical protein
MLQKKPYPALSVGQGALAQRVFLYENSGPW